MQRYSEYKDSGVQWLGEIPSHWEVIKSKYLWMESFSTSMTGNEDLLSVSQYDGITPAKSDSRSESLKGYKIVAENDLVVNIMLAWMGGLGVSKYKGIVSPAYCIYKLKRQANPKFLHYLYKTPLYLAEFARRSSGVIPSRWRMYTDDFGQILSLLPPLHEQDLIVGYLDKVTSKIDTAIAQQQKMIDLLNERKQIIINNAVTKGLDPNVKMKDSGVEWIGEIPEHWEVVPIKRYVSVKTGRTPSTSKEYYFENGNINWYTPGDLNGINLVDSDRQVTFRAKKEDACSVYPIGTVYLVGIGSTIGKVAYAEHEASCNQQINALLPQKNKVFYKYLAHLLLSTKIQIIQNANFSTLPILNQERTGDLLMMLPPITEQSRIVDFIENSIKPIGDAILVTEKQISLLQERKQIIINDVVTGKVKVV
ncbi:MAG: restriction endonuclease subunit S [Bacteroidaceae bacterium]|nr:restriction endonuclease subunit S [Bacteroidaceae bacterium]